MTPVLYMCDCITILAVKKRLTLTSMREFCVEGVAMSTRVALPMYVGCRMSELRRQLLPSPTPSQDRTAQVRKNLFGPIDHDENIKFVQDELDKISQADCQRWNFDFQAEKPKEGRYSWEPVGEGVPQAYEMSRLTYLTTHAATTTTSPHTTIAAPTPVRKVPEGGGTSTTTTTTAVDQPSTSTQTTTSTPTSTPTSTTTTTTSTTTTVMDKPTKTTTTRLSTSVSSASATSASEAATSKSVSEVVVKKFIGDTEKLDTIEHKSLPVLRCTRSRSSQPPLTAFMKIQKSKRPASTKLEEDPPALVKRPRTTSS